MKKNGYSAMAIGHNEDLTTPILLRLPVKSVLRFKTVSKQWLSIVSSGRFRQIHAASNVAATATGIFFDKDSVLEFVSLGNHTCPIPNSDQPMKILSSSGGLLLLLLQSRDYCICNPATNEIKSLAAVVPQVIRESTHMVACLAFDPSESPHYKILFVYRLKNSFVNNHKLLSMIYSSKTRTFRSLETNFIDIPIEGIYWNDAIHWTTCGSRLISYFDLSKELVFVHHLPISVSGYSSYIAEYRGHLLMLTANRDDFCKNNSVFKVYESKRDYSAGWFLKYKVDIASIGIQFPLTSNPIYDSVFVVFGIVADEEQDLSMVILLRGCAFVACNFKKKLSNVLQPRAHPSNMCYGYPYKETLACV